MSISLAEALRILKDHEPELRRRGVMRALEIISEAESAFTRSRQLTK